MNIPLKYRTMGEWEFKCLLSHVVGSATAAQSSRTIWSVGGRDSSGLIVEEGVKECGKRCLIYINAS